MVDSGILSSLRGREEEVVRYMASKNLMVFARYMRPDLEMTSFHRTYYKVLDMFAHKRIKKLIVSVPPQHGKSEGSSRILPAFIEGLNPDTKLIIGSYNGDVASSFNVDVQKIIQSEAYKAVFPDTFLNTDRVKMNNVYKCNSEVSDMVGHRGYIRGVGRSGSLTSKSVDVAILDDVYKDFDEANSSLIRERAWKWYTTVVSTRLHNDSQQLIVFTRWHEDDLIGRIEKGGERIKVLEKWSDLEEVRDDEWLLLNFPALKVGEPTEIDPRKDGEALWEDRHSRKKLLAQRGLDPVQFECLYQGDPSSEASHLYGEFKTYVDKSEWGTLVRRGCMIDVADKGDDYLASVTYDIYKSPNNFYNENTRKFEPILFALVTDILFTQEPTEKTILLVPAQVNLQGSQRVFCETNNGGEQFANSISKRIKATMMKFHTSVNKESKIISNASGVMQSIVMPFGWENRYSEAYRHLSGFLRNFRGNSHDDIEDCLTEIYLREIAPCSTKGYSSQNRGIKRRN